MTGARCTDPPDWLLEVAARLPHVTVEDVLPRHPAPRGGRGSAVLMLIGPSGGNRAAWDVLLTERATGLRAHSGQAAFPGGASDPDDDGPVATALREAREEVGLDPLGVQVLGMLPGLPLPVSGYVVTPVLAWWATPGPVQVVDPVEVAEVVRVPLAELVDPSNRFQVRYPNGYTGAGFAVRGLFVWGFTALLQSWFLDAAGLSVPWDTTRFEPLPDLGRR